jgi:hypothetical protein
MFQRFLAFLTRQIVTDVPDEIAACMECGVDQCVEAKFRNCPNRLARVAALKAMRTDGNQQANVTL